MTKKNVLLFVGIVAVITFIVVMLIVNGIIIFDHSGERRGDGVYWNGVFYVPCSGEYTEGKTIAKTNDRWQINEVGEDDTHTFVVMRSFLDQRLLVRENYTIPTAGEITTAFWNNKVITDKAFYTALTEIIDKSKSEFEYITDGISNLKDDQIMSILYVGYEGCPIATVRIGYMGQVNGTWYITTEISDGRNNADGSPKPYKVSCYTIPQEYIEVLEKHFD